MKEKGEAVGEEEEEAAQIKEKVEVAGEEEEAA